MRTEIGEAAPVDARAASGPYGAVLVMGVCGSGKTSVGRALAERLSARYLDADDFHPLQNVEAMRAGQPLTDAMRAPWLSALADAVEAARHSGPVVFACSALKRSYRDLLRTRIGRLQIVHLTGTRDVIAERMAARPDHFMPVALLDSQLADLEEPGADECPLLIDVQQPFTAVVNAAEARLPRLSTH